MNDLDKARKAEDLRTGALLPCPFCGSDSVRENAVYNTGGYLRFKWCKACNAHGPWAQTPLHSPTDAWNRRALSTPVPMDHGDGARTAGHVEEAGLDNSRAGFVTVAKKDLLDLLDNNLEAARIAMSSADNIDSVEERGGADSEEDSDQLYYYLFYSLHPAQRLRDTISVQVEPPDTVAQLQLVQKWREESEWAEDQLVCNDGGVGGATHARHADELEATLSTPVVQPDTAGRASDDAALKKRIEVLEGAVEHALSTLICSCAPFGNTDVDDASEIKHTIQVLQDARLAPFFASIEQPRDFRAPPKLTAAPDTGAELAATVGTSIFSFDPELFHILQKIKQGGDNVAHVRKAIELMKRKERTPLPDTSAAPSDRAAFEQFAAVIDEVRKTAWNQRQQGQIHNPIYLDDLVARLCVVRDAIFAAAAPSEGAGNDELETLRMQLAGCGVATMCNTPETAAAQRIGPDSPYWCASYSDVCKAVDREMALRTELAALKASHAGLQDSTELLLDVLDDLAGECDAVAEYQAPIRMAREALAAAKSL